MPLPLPSLDKRTFTELVAEGRSLIPQLAPTWTDHNAHDPGITLMELLAWLVEQDSYRLDRIPDAQYRAFLRLVGIEPKPAQVAETIVVFSLKASNDAVSLPAGLQIATTHDSQSHLPITFQTVEPVEISPAQLVSVLTHDNDTWVEYHAENLNPGQRYRPLGDNPKPETALYLEFARPLATTALPISLYVWVNSADVDRETRQHLITEWERLQQAARHCPSGVQPNIPDWQQHYSARTVWEYFSSENVWVPLDGIIDETRGLTLSGPVRFIAPIDQMAGGGPKPDQFYIRCRLLSGEYECPPEIDAIALNAIRAIHAADIQAEEVLGKSNGQAGQVFSVDTPQIVPGSTRLRFTPGNLPLNQVPIIWLLIRQYNVLAGVFFLRQLRHLLKQKTWQEVPFWDSTGPHDRNYTLLPERNGVAFGNGRVGWVPAAQEEIRIFYQVGGGPEGNLKANQLNQFGDLPHNSALVPTWSTIKSQLKEVTQPFPATGGAPAESLKQAQSRALSSLAQRHRAITLTDFETLALATPGVPVAKARALADYHPALPCIAAAGSVTIVVIPHCSAPTPIPGAAFLQAVKQYLEPRRSLTTEVHVVGPIYIPVMVQARLHVEPQTDVQHIVALSQKTLDTFFHPLHGGPDSMGWPVGRDVYRSEVMALLSALPGVQYLDHFGLRTEADAEPRCDNLPICPDGLVASGHHQIEVIERSLSL